jgi:acetyl-CoA hydrolase
VIAQLAASQFRDVDVWTEVLQDTMLDWFETGKLRHASTAALALSKPAFQRLYKDFSFYEDKIILRCVLP